MKTENQRKLFTLCLAKRKGRVLLGMKKRGFGAGRWNGFGGKVNPDESIYDAAKREVWEETGLKIKRMTKFSVIEFKFRGKPEILECHNYFIEKFSGRAKETEEMKPKWFPIDNIPFDLMWPDDKFWIPLFLAGKKFKARFNFGKNDKILKQKIEEVNSI
ncbi:MAG: 7,8-dihydro-8-oxoguanine triphosphatase [Candidatus Yanofskybacteria bacterium GW2011_GWA1_44_21]|uniref:Oxidized purine nucleoside triphosphate hydrolase n=2 Tax=Candidatus Yanofskyibacteriota TaxID=1752733 RepID=A0A1F8H305_9BACT|nr:MAG: 7,8-dihydro-8-oxoguanine triphosphatase [Candidatus Yanofskybacteria bacterium GW2011_GWA2_44_10]KKT50893.1 MAG: 7,8-dihydro-8-oxoguanine triphosphatase [Candidatus Yanofskybacteria bacterium GW2011_GWA1_44_21]KKT90465.1 MAG: 7,8-dihydro-8-oxoguanine triphosphatase [Candidatus Yanofskybacteria bacterium GW2011_GWB1_45_11]OGN03101.1 MAG: hypothetical protein A2657_01740 [Candidatus Yanofskybacteria bacterium RIFCSPHIGHO2_01_FULL_44_110b]OGN14272.1 MAG: hypothetical protein A3C01_01625 [C